MKKPVPPDVEVSVTETLNFERTMKISVGIKNSFPATDSNGRWSSIAPFISASIDIPVDSDVEATVSELYERMLPAYGFLILQEFTRMQRVNEKGLMQEAFDLLGMNHGKD